LRKSPQAQTLKGQDRFSPGALQGVRPDDLTLFPTAATFQGDKWCSRLPAQERFVSRVAC
jgi:hypothetical protein